MTLLRGIFSAYGTPQCCPVSLLIRPLFLDPTAVPGWADEERCPVLYPHYRHWGAKSHPGVRGARGRGNPGQDLWLRWARWKWEVCNVHRGRPPRPPSTAVTHTTSLTGFCAQSCCRRRGRAAVWVLHQQSGQAGRAPGDRSARLLGGCGRAHGIFHRWAEPQSLVPLAERGGVAAWVRR